MIVGCVGFIGSGKGTVGDILIKKGFIKESFAGTLKDVASVMFNWPREMLEGDTEESRKWRELPDEYWSVKLGRSFSPRYALQYMGTEVGRDMFHTDFWLYTLEKRVHNNKNYVITDVRFPNEMQWIKKQGGMIIEVRRGTSPHWYNIAAAANRGDVSAEEFMRKEGIHDSEWKWIGMGIDHLINNDSSLENLEEQIDKCLTT